jgi:hypothetical protein
MMAPQPPGPGFPFDDPSVKIIAFIWKVLLHKKMAIPKDHPALFN